MCTKRCSSESYDEMSVRKNAAARMLALVPALSPSHLERHICASSVRHGDGRDAHSNISTTIRFVLMSLKVFRFPVYLSDPL